MLTFAKPHVKSFVGYGAGIQTVRGAEGIYRGSAHACQEDPRRVDPTTSRKVLSHGTQGPRHKGNAGLCFYVN